MGRIIGYVLFVVAVVWVLHFMDRSAYGRAERLYDRVRRAARSGEAAPDLQLRRDGDAVVVAASGIQADMCNAFTGGLWFDFLMPRLSSVRHLHPNVRSRSGYCDRAGTNTLLFRFEGGETGQDEDGPGPAGERSAAATRGTVGSQGFASEIAGPRLSARPPEA